MKTKLTHNPSCGDQIRVQIMKNPLVFHLQMAYLLKEVVNRFLVFGRLISESFFCPFQKLPFPYRYLGWMNLKSGRQFAQRLLFFQGFKSHHCLKFCCEFPLALFYRFNVKLLNLTDGLYFGEYYIML